MHREHQEMKMPLSKQSDIVQTNHTVCIWRQHQIWHCIDKPCSLLLKMKTKTYLLQQLSFCLLQDGNISTESVRSLFQLLLFLFNLFFVLHYLGMFLIQCLQCFSGLCNTTPLLLETVLAVTKPLFYLLETVLTLTS